jgi:O-antigen chain-terminating methyltransferase
MDIAEALRLHGQRHAEELNRASMTAVNEVLDALRLTLEQYGDVLRDDRRRLDGLNRAVRRLEQPHAPTATASASAATSASASVASAPADDISPDLYLALEDRFRGSVELIAERQRAYLPYLAELPFPERPVADLGCGRGEFLSLLRDKGIPAFGVDNNPDAVTVTSELGVEVRQNDLMAFLRSTEDASLRAITMFQVVEHLPFAVLAQFFDEAVRVLVPGGLLLAETPNALNLRVAATTFWLDPTHQHPLHPELLAFLAKEAGVARSDGLFVNPARPLADRPDKVERLRYDLVDGPQDFALLAWTAEG